MEQEMRLPRESVIDLALLLDEHLESEEAWCSGDQVMDLYHLRVRLRERSAELDEILAGIRLQGVAVALSSRQKESVRKGALNLIEVCLHLLQACDLLEPDAEGIAPNR